MRVWMSRSRCKSCSQNKNWISLGGHKPANCLKLSVGIYLHLFMMIHWLSQLSHFSLKFDCLLIAEGLELHASCGRMNSLCLQIIVLRQQATIQHCWLFQWAKFLCRFWDLKILRILKMEIFFEIFKILCDMTIGRKEESQGTGCWGLVMYSPLYKFWDGSWGALVIRVTLWLSSIHGVWE